MAESRHLHAAVLVTACALLSACGTIDAVKKMWSDDDPEAVAAVDLTPRVQILVEGVDEVLADNIRATLTLAGEACDAPRWRAEHVFARSETDVRRALRALGHYQPEIEKSFDEVDECWQAVYVIDAGPQVVFGDIDVLVEGPAEDDPAFHQLLADLLVKSGEALNHGRYEGLKRSIESVAAERGYFDGRFTRNELRVDIEAGRADVMLRFDSGRRYRVGDIAFHQTAFDEDLIERLTQLRSGTPYDSTELAAQNRTYSDTGYFSAVDISPRLREAQRNAAEADESEQFSDVSGDDESEGEDRSRDVAVDVTLTPRPKHSYTVGAGYSTDVGPRGRLGYENRRLNRGGHRWSADAIVSPRDSEFNLGYRIPLQDPRTEWLSFQAGYQVADTKTFETRTARFSVNKTGARYDWLETQSLDITHDSFTVGDVDSSTLLVVPGISWQKIVADNPLRPMRGWSALLQLHTAYEGLLSDTSFVRGNLRTNAIYGLPWDDRLLGRLEVGATAVADFDVLPPDYRFFAGGDTSIRGYAYESLGPKDDKGLVIGGRYLMVGSLEYEHALNAKWALAAFVDAGNAYDDFGEGINVGVGGGVRWLTPVGPLRLDIGVPLDDDDTTFRVHLRFGPDL